MNKVKLTLFWGSCSNPVLCGKTIRTIAETEFHETTVSNWVHYLLTDANSSKLRQKTTANIKAKKLSITFLGEEGEQLQLPVDEPLLVLAKLEVNHNGN